MQEESVRQYQVVQTRMQRLTSNPVTRGIAGGFVGMCLALALVGAVYVGWTLYRDHVILRQVVQIIQQAQQAAAATK